MDNTTKIHESASSDAVRFFHEAITAEQRGDIQGAYQLLIAAIKDDASLPGVWNNLGLILHKLKRYPAAVAAFYKAHTLAPDAPLPLANYGWALHLAGRSEEALSYVERAIEIESAKGTHYTNLSQIQLALGDLEGALQSARMAVAFDETNGQPYLALALALLRSGDYQQGLSYYEARLTTNPVLNAMLRYPFPIWRGEELSDKRLFIPCEQGIGDSVMFLRFIPEAAKRAKKVVVHVHAQALKLFKRNLAQFKNVIVEPIPSELPPADYYCPTLSLPLALQLTNEDIAKSWFKYKYAWGGAELKDKGLRIGICWAGDPAHDNDKFRSSTLEDFLLLAEIPNVKLYSLQIGARALDLDTLGTHGTIRDLSPFIKDVNDTAAIMASQLDMVVSVDTAAAHIAASMGVPTALLVGLKSVDWRWQTGGGPSVWYPTLTMFKQKTSGDWREVIARVKKEFIQTAS